MSQSFTNSKLTERESQVFEAFKYLDKTRRSTPTQEEIAAFLGCHKSTVNRAFNGLEQKGKIGSETGRSLSRLPRSYRVADFRRRKKVSAA